MIKENTILSRGQLEQLMPDYILGKLGQSEKDAFEQSMGSYPDILNETQKAQKLFEVLSITDFDKEISQRTRNLSVSVNQRLIKKQAHKPFIKTLGLQYFIPALAVAAMMIFVFKGFNKEDIKPNNKVNPEVVKNLNSEEFRYLKPAETERIISPKMSTDDYMEIAANTVKTIDDPNSELVNPYGKNNGKIIDDLYREDLMDQSENMGQYLIETATQTNSFKMLDGLEQLKDDDLESILEELENANENI